MNKKENFRPSSSGRNHYILVLIFFIFLVIALLSNVLGAIIPDLIKSFSLSLTAASLVHVCFWGAYGPVSIPAGMLVEKIYDRPVLLFASVLCLIGIIVFALMPVYSIVLPSFAFVTVITLQKAAPFAYYISGDKT